MGGWVRIPFASSRRELLRTIREFLPENAGPMLADELNLNKLESYPALVLISNERLKRNMRLARHDWFPGEHVVAVVRLTKNELRNILRQERWRDRRRLTLEDLRIDFGKRLCAALYAKTLSSVSQGLRHDPRKGIYLNRGYWRLKVPT
jgi:hypothetical protein